METKQQLFQKPRYYADACVRKGLAYSEYETAEFDYEYNRMPCSDIEDYELVRKLGRGKYSEVFEGINSKTDAKCVVKILKPIRSSKVKRQIKILQNLKGGVNVIRLEGLVKDPSTKTVSLICEYVNNSEHRRLYPTLSDADVRFYILEILKCLDFCHSNGIMHRDIKPQNVMINHERKQLRVIDWGLAQFYFPGKEYNVRVASRYFKGPELLVDYQYYDYSLDIWSLGVMFAGIVQIFMRDPFFMGSSNEDQLNEIAKVLGTKDLMEYLKMYKLTLSAANEKAIGRHTKKSWESFITEQNRRLAVPDAIDLLSKMLVYDHASRILPKEAMKHPYFKDLC